MTPQDERKAQIEQIIEQSHQQAFRDYHTVFKGDAVMMISDMNASTAMIAAEKLIALDAVEGRLKAQLEEKLNDANELLQRYLENGTVEQCRVHISRINTLKEVLALFEQ